jgi:murein DD-endopeptidase MepM/ murein hydrolase activator NlpD
MVTIDHGFGYKSRYAHLQSIKVKMGDEVLRGQIVGTLGNTGRSTGPHLHYEVFYNNVKINPINFLGELPPDLYEMMVKNVGGGN